MDPFLSDGEQDPEAMDEMCLDTAERIRTACGDRTAIVAAIERFLDFGDAGEYSPAALWDYFATSSPTVPEVAGCDPEAEDRVIRIFSTCTHARYSDGRPLPADWPWHEQDV